MVRWWAGQWCEALAAHFFTERSSGLPVLFFVDDELLARLHPSGDVEIAVASLAESVRVGLCNNPQINGYFNDLERAGRTWRLRGGHGVPPVLHLLGLCVLAATHMGEGETSANNYYLHVRRLIGLTGGGTPKGFGDSLDYLWEHVYTWWLDTHLGGRRGLSTVVVDSHRSHVSRPISQTLFMGSDVRLLDDFFRWIQLAPGERVDEDVLVTYFRAWGPGRALSLGAERLLSDEQFWPTLGRILAAYAANWDGTRVDRQADRIATLRVVVSLSFPRSVSLLALQPPGYPGRLGGIIGGAHVSVAAVDGVFVASGEVTSRQLLRGGEATAGSCRLKLDAGDVYILRLDPELGGWASVSAFAPGERHAVLVSPRIKDSVERQLKAASKEAVSIERAPGALAEWSLVRNVILVGDVPLTGALAEAQPTVRHRFALKGGLPLEASASYLSGGAPDVWLPTIGEGALSLTLDGRPLPTGDERVRLADHLPAVEAATHYIRYADALDRRLMMIESARLKPPASRQPGHLIDTTADGSVEVHRTTSATESGEMPGATVTVVGPHVRGARDDWRQSPVLLRRHAAQAWLIGAVPGQVIEVTRPPKAEWMKAHRLSGQLYEARAPFVAVYSIETWSLQPFRRARQRAALEPSAEDRDRDIALWARLLLSAELADGDLDLWASYQAAASGLLERGDP
jgi:hypothetical protein